MTFRYTNVVLGAEMSFDHLDLQTFARCKPNVVYNPSKFSTVVCKHKKLGGSCLLFRSAQLICPGILDLETGKKTVRKYARLIQKVAGGDLKKIRIITMAGLAKLDRQLSLDEVARQMDGTYEPELFNPCTFDRENVHFKCFSTGKVVIAGIRTEKQLENVVYPCLMELELL